MCYSRSIIAIDSHASTLVLQRQVVHLCPVRGAHHVPCLNHPGIHSKSEGPCRDRAHQVPRDRKCVKHGSLGKFAFTHGDENMFFKYMIL